MERRIRLIDVTLRDGNQSLWSATGITTPMILAVASDLDRVGFKALDFTTSTHMAVSVRWHREDPFERIRLARERMPRTPLTFMTTGLRFIRWEPCPRELIRLAMRTVIRHGIRRVQVVDPMNNVAEMVEGARMAREEGAEEVVVALVYSISPVHTDDFYTRRVRELGEKARGVVDAVYIKDPAGLLTPDRVGTLVPALQEALGDTPLEVHSHCNMGLAPVCYVRAAELGVRTFHTAIPPLAEGTSLPNFFRTVANLQEMGFEMEVDLEAAERVSRYFFQVARRRNLPIGRPSEYDLAYYRHQIPGGMVTTLKRNLREIGQEDKFEAVLDEIVRVRAELGYPIMMTPFSQFVATQALLNLIGPERYHLVADETIRYILGQYGEPPGPIDPEVRDRVLSLPRAKEIPAERPELSIAELRGIYGGRSDEEVLLRYGLPEEEVQAIQRGKVAPLVLDGKGTGEALKRLVEALSSEPRKVTYVRLERKGLGLTLRRGQAS
ncbi:MAG: biotin carboxyl carrier protein [Armatimonadota bacterium]|nr:biotin carboxyl carrier protein [Armatimonadota bacterium]MDR7439524.1 biotin carboxyl carrier protein [Armatimonadota bacterium]MDR7563442.1 biotin carboxyl carrier protein [Armatimonadota bacterium]MDR7567462.1 biotin carboxyl carrier protein [Armatimonadota bacterium]MDR7602676.1 biotin carboxyl carrier protein [Armatimonadota bacterium]